MANKKRMSVAEMLAAARQIDGGEATASGAETPQPAASSAETAASSAVEPAPSSEKSSKPAASKASSGGGGRPGVADILAMARGGGDTPSEAPQKTPVKKSSPKPAAAKPAAAKAKTSPAPPKPAGPRDTASILAAARNPDRPGPISKAEAAKRGVAVEKPQPVLPPMPVKPAYAKPEAAKEPRKVADEERRSFLTLGFAGLAAVGLVWTLAVARFMFPNVRREPPTQFKVGFPGDFAPGQVETKFKASRGVWIVNTEYHGQQQLFALKSVCTHLGCTPNWLEAEQKFKCPCHGSGFYKNGINFEGPAPRPLERFAIRRADDGQVEVDKSRTFQEEMGQWEESACYINV